MLKRHAMLAAVCLVALNVVAGVPQAAAQSTAAERKVLQEQKKREADEKRRAAEEQRKAKAEHDKAIAPRECDFPQHDIKFKSPLGWMEAANPPGMPAGADGAGVATAVSLDYSPPALPKPPEGVQVFKPRYTIEVVTLPEGVRLDAFVEQTNKTFAPDNAAAAGNRLKLAPAKDVTVGGLPAKLIVATTKTNDPRPETIRRVVTVNGRRGYVFQLVSPQILHGRASMSAEQIERSVTFGKGETPVEPKTGLAIDPSPAAPPATSPSVYEHAKDRFRLQVPVGWKVEEEKGVSLTLLLDNPAKPEGADAFLRIYRRSTTFPTSAADEMASWRRRWEGTYTYGEQTATTVDGVEAFTADRVLNESSKSQRVVTFTRGTDAYALQLHFNAEMNPEAPQTLAAILESFEFVGEAVGTDALAIQAEKNRVQAAARKHSTVVSRPDFRLKFKRPESWFPFESGFEQIVGSYRMEPGEPAPGEFMSTMILLVERRKDEPPPNAAKVYLDDYLNQDAKASVGFETVSEEDIKVDGVDARRAVTTTKLMNIIPVKRMHVVIWQRDLCYVFLYTAKPDEFDKRLPEVQQLIDSVDFLDVPAVSP